jgi:PRC-barrel domain
MKKCIAALAVLCALTACRSAPVAERATANTGPPPSSDVPLRAVNEQSLERSIKVPIEIPIETELETPIVAPVCIVPPIAPPKHPPSSKPETPPPAPPAPPAAPADGIDAKVRPLEGSVESILGKKVQGAKGDDLGRVVDVLADEGGRVRAAVIEFGGFLGVGNRRIAVDWSLLRFHPEDEDHALVLSVSVKTLQSVPEYKNSPHPQALTSPQASTAPQSPTSQQPPPAAPAPNAVQGNK